MSGGQEGSLFVNKEGAAVDTRNIEEPGRILIQTYDRGNGSLRLINRVDERIALADGPAVAEQQNLQNEKPIDQTTGPVNGTVSPYVARCIVHSEKGVWNVQCPEFAYPAHSVPPSGN
jgi:hypothetical protein